jgi:capsular polysaccharide biosynthesis protein
MLVRQASQNAMLKRTVRFALRHAAIPVCRALLHPSLAPLPGKVGRMAGLKPSPPSSVVLQTRDWASLPSADGRSFLEVAPGESLKRPAPVCFGSPLDWRFRRHLEGFNPPLFIATLPRGRVVGRSGAVITPDNRLLGDLSSDWFFQPQQHPLFFRLKLPAIQPLAGTIINFARLSGWNYAHWVLDVLPRLDILRRAGQDWRAAEGYLFNGPEEDFKTETLDLLGFPREKRHFTSAATHFQCERLIAPSWACKPDQTPPWVVDFLRKAFVTAAKTPAAAARIYISRSKAKFRKVLNDNQVVDLLQHRGFKSVCCEDLSFREKVDLFASAEAVVAPHGAGLTHLAFCRPGTKVIEYFSPRYVNPFFWVTSCAGGLNYACVMGAGRRPAEGNDPQDAESNIQVDIGDLEQALAHLGL